MDNDNLAQLNDIENFFLNSTVDISLAGFILSIIISVFLGYIIKFTYLKNSQTLSNKLYFSDQFITLAAVTCLVITVIKFSLALSLGLVGALSIVRFRAAIKEPEELVYLFFVIGIGLACGANQYIIAIFSTLTISLVIFITTFLKKRSEFKSNYAEINVIQISIKNKNEANKINDIISNLERFTNFIKLKSSFINEDQNTYIIWTEFKDHKNYLSAIEYTNDLNKGDNKLEFSFTMSENIYE